MKYIFTTLLIITCHNLAYSQVSTPDVIQFPPVCFLQADQLARKIEPLNPIMVWTLERGLRREPAISALRTTSFEQASIVVQYTFIEQQVDPMTIPIQVYGLAGAGSVGQLMRSYLLTQHLPTRSQLATAIETIYNNGQCKRGR